MIARVPGLMKSFYETDVHDMCAGLFRGKEEVKSTLTLRGVEEVRIPQLDPKPVLKPEVECLLKETYHQSPWIELEFDPGGSKLANRLVNK